MGELNGTTYVGTWNTQPEYLELADMLADGSLFGVLSDVLGAATRWNRSAVSLSKGLRKRSPFPEVCRE